MKRVTMTLLALAVLVGASTTQAGWRIRIQRGQTITEVALSEVDHITFHESIVPVMVRVPAGTFTMGDGESPCGVDEHQVTLTRDFYLGRHEVTNLEYMEMLQWAFDNGYVTATEDSVQDALDGSTVTLLRMDNEFCEIRLGGDGKFYLRESPSSEAQAAYPEGYDPAPHPVKMVTWFGAARYCDWLSLRKGLARAYEHDGDWSCNGGDPYGAEGFRLPTDAEWEYAAQYNDDRIYPWGDEGPDCSRSNYAEDSLNVCVGWTSRVGSYPAAPAQLGLLDMAGNMAEMCNDRFVRDLGTYARTDPVGPPGGTGRVIRGGCWFDTGTGERGLRSAARGYVPSGCPDISDGLYFGCLGFRAARTVTP